MNFTVYSREGCGHCDRIKTVLRLTGCTYVVYNLGEDFTREEFIAEFGEGSTSVSYTHLTLPTKA